MAGKIIYDITINMSFYPRIVDPIILKLCPEGNYEPLYVCNQYTITFGTRKRLLGFCNTYLVYCRYRYPIVNKNNAMKFVTEYL